jgi:hypothetical protein
MHLFLSPVLPLGLSVLDLQRRLVLQFSLGTLGHALGKVLLHQR